MTYQELHQTVEYRKATPDDVNSLAEMNEQLIQDEKHRFPVSIVQLSERMSEWLSGEYNAVIFSMHGFDIGYALYRHEPHWVCLRQFYVRSSHRRIGIGPLVIQFLRKTTWQDSPRIRLDVLVENAAGIAFWKAIGFKDYCITMELATRSDVEVRIKESNHNSTDVAHKRVTS